MIRDDWHNNPEHLARFAIEAEAAARLNHPNIVRIYAIGEVGLVPYFSLELLEGGTLKQRLAGTPQPFREAATLMATLARAVHAAHKAGILHRDIKPSNVLFDMAGTPKIADFGLAKRLEVDEGQTHTGQVIGTPSYMAPEQAKGWDKDIGPAADIYSLGAILYEVLTGRPPVKGSTPVETVRLVQEEEPVPPSRLRPKLPFDLETICLKCINRDPRKRYADALILAEDLDRYLAGESILAPNAPLGARNQASSKAAGHLGTRCGWHVRRWNCRRGGHACASPDSRLAETRGGPGNRLAASEQSRPDRSRMGPGAVSSRRRPGDRRPCTKPPLEELGPSSGGCASTPNGCNRRRRSASRNRPPWSGFKRGSVVSSSCVTRRSFWIQPGLVTAWVTRSRQPARPPLTHCVFSASAAPAMNGLSPHGRRRLPEQQRKEVKSGFYQILLILADATSLLPGATPAKRADEALRIVTCADGLLPRTTKAYHLHRAEFLELKGDRQGAVRERAEAGRLAPVDAFDFFLMGREATRRSDWATAIEQLAEATQKDPDNFWAQCLLAICYLQTNEPAAARSGLNGCLQRKPDQAWLVMLRGIANAGIARKTMVGRAAQDLDDVQALFRDADADFQKALHLIGDKARHADLYYALLINRGTMWLVRDNLAHAAADFQAAVSLNPGRFEAIVDLGQVYQRQKRIDEAVKQFARAIELRPTDATLYRGRRPRPDGCHRFDGGTAGDEAKRPRIGDIQASRRAQRGGIARPCGCDPPRIAPQARRRRGLDQASHAIPPARTPS